jgi:prefoldin subunit 5
MQEILVAAIVGGLGLIGTAIGAKAGYNKAIAVFEVRINALEKKQDKHNQLIERMAKVEASAASAHHRIDEIKGGKK